MFVLKDTQCPKGRPQKSLGAQWMRQFVLDEDGAILGFAIFIFLIILMVGGIGIDFMRSEMKRTQMQHTLDRAILAAANMDQSQEPSGVVRDYFVKNGMSDHITSVTVEEGTGFRAVSASAKHNFDTMFMHMAGVGDLTVPASGAAAESIGAMEVSLVLDISGSMRYNQRLANLKVAAKEFVSALLDNAQPNSLSISIIPYATQVNAGENLLSKFNVTQEHDYSHCVNFISDQFSRSTLIRTEELERTAHFDPWTYSEGSIDIPVCPVRASSAILPLSNDRTVLHNYIDGMTAQGNTSIDLGVKWGTALLDPSLRTVVTDLIADGDIPSAFSGRPSNYDGTGAKKVLIVMSDGANTDQYMLNPSIRTGLSDVWYNAETGRYSVYHSNGTPMYYWPHTDYNGNNPWYDHPYGNGQSPVCGYDSNGYYNCSNADEPGEAVQLTYPELLNRVSLHWNAYYNYAFTSSAFADWTRAAVIKRESASKDQFTNHICDAAKDQGILVYTIGFEAPRRGNRVLKRCASSDSHFFDADGLDIRDAFAAIALSIRQLRLTQ